jgi:hypothetical protein
MVSGILFWVFVVVGLGLMVGSGTIGVRLLLARRRPGSAALIAAVVGYAVGGAVLLRAQFPASVI